MKISNIDLEIIKDSKGDDTLQAKFSFSDFSCLASVPAGTSKGKNEIPAISPNKALKDFMQIKDKILSHQFQTICDFDNFIKRYLTGGNLILVLSIAFTKLLAKVNNLDTYQLIARNLNKTPSKFPYLFFNLLEGGLHARLGLPFQEYILVSKFSSPKKGLEFVKKEFEKLKQEMPEYEFGMEGGLAIQSDDPSLGLNILNRNMTDPNICLALDVAASSFYADGKYTVGKNVWEKDQLLNLYMDLVKKFPLLSIEDPFSQDDRDGFRKMSKSLKQNVWIVGDDLTVTNAQLIKQAACEDLITGVIIKPNQIGSVSDTLEAIKMAQGHNLKVIMSHRSGETLDDFIADLAFGSEADGLKAGAPTQPERLIKYNRLIEIERQIN